MLIKIVCLLIHSSLLQGGIRELGFVQFAVEIGNLTASVWFEPGSLYFLLAFSMHCDYVFDGGTRDSWLSTNSCDGRCPYAILDPALVRAAGSKGVRHMICYDFSAHPPLLVAQWAAGHAY